MSLFDIIRYPISDPPTEQELTALPVGMMCKWLQMTDWKEISPARTNIADVVEYYEFASNDSSAPDGCKELALQELVLLRKMIREYEPV